MLQDANFQNRSSMVMYVAGLGIAHVDFAIFGVAGVGVVRGVGGAKEVAFVTFRVVEGVKGIQGSAIVA